MKKIHIENLKKGISLEKSKTIIPWKTDFNKLKNYGNPEMKTQTSREIVIWKEEQILNGLTVDLNAMYEPGIFGHNKHLKNVSAYISETDYENTKRQLGIEFNRKGKYKKHNEQEFSYTWKINGCRVVLSHIDSFGTFYKISIEYHPSLSGFIDKFNFTKLKEVFSKLLHIGDHSHFLMQDMRYLKIGAYN